MTIEKNRVPSTMSLLFSRIQFPKWNVLKLEHWMVPREYPIEATRVKHLLNNNNYLSGARRKHEVYPH